MQVAPFSFLSAHRCPTCAAEYFGRHCPFCLREHVDGEPTELDGMTQHQVAELMGISRCRVGQIEQRALEKLRVELERRGFCGDEVAVLQTAWQAVEEA